MELALRIVELLGIVAFAVSGVIAAKDKEMDFIGVYVVAMMTALGGGTVRDLLIGRPVFWVGGEFYPLFVFAASVASVPLVTRIKRNNRVAFGIDVLDALGIGLFSVVGSAYAAEKGCPFLVAAMMGVVTCIMGGILRDVSCNEIPVVFRRTQLYATCSFLGSVAYLALLACGPFWAPTALVAGAAVTFCSRIAAIRYDLRLPI